MKKIFFILALIALAVAAQAQLKITKGIAVSPENKAISNGEIAVLDSAKIGIPLQRQIDQKVGVASIVDYTATLYSKTEVNNLLLYYPRRLETVTNARIDHTGTTAETTLVTINIPAGSLGPNGEVRIWVLFSVTNSATNKVIRLKDQSANVLFSSGNVTTTVNEQVYTWIRNRNSLTAQIAPGMSTFGNLSGAAPITITHNSALGLTFTLTGQCSGSASDHIYIESIVVEYIHGGN